MTFSHNPHLALILYTPTSKQTNKYTCIIYTHTHTYIIVHSNWPIRFISWMWLFLLEVCHRMINKTFKITNQTFVQWDYSSTLTPAILLHDIFIPNETIYKQTFWLMSSALWVSGWSSYYFFCQFGWTCTLNLQLRTGRGMVIDTWKLSPTLWTGRVPQDYFNWPEQSQSNTENKGLLLHFILFLIKFSSYISLVCFCVNSVTLLGSVCTRFELPLGLWPSVV